MNALTIVHETIRKFVGAGDVVIDATAGADTIRRFYARLSGTAGKLFLSTCRKTPWTAPKTF